MRVERDNDEVDKVEEGNIEDNVDKGGEKKFGSQGSVAGFSCNFESF